MIDRELMAYREDHVRRFVVARPDLVDVIDQAIPGECAGEKASDTLARLRRQGES